MTANRNFKRLVRARARKTGESYTAALRHFRERAAGGDAMTDTGGHDAHELTGANLDRFREDAVAIMRFTIDEARRLRHNYVGTEHLLLGLARAGAGGAGQILSDLGVDLIEVRRAVEAIVGQGDFFPTRSAPEIGIMPRAQTALRLAVDEARALGDDGIGSEHLLLGLLVEGRGIAAGILNRSGVYLGDVRARVRAARESGGGSSPLPAQS